MPPIDTNFHLLSVAQKIEKELQSQLNKDSPTFEDIQHLLTQSVIVFLSYRTSLMISGCALLVKQLSLATSNMLLSSVYNTVSGTRIV